MKTFSLAVILLGLVLYFFFYRGESVNFLPRPVLEKSNQIEKPSLNTGPLSDMVVPAVKSDDLSPFGELIRFFSEEQDNR